MGSGCSVDSAKSRYILAEKLWTDGKYAAAVSEFEKVTQKDPQGKLGLQALFRGAMTDTLYLNKQREALRKFRDYVERGGDPATAWEAQKQVGEILFAKAEQYDQAVQHYRALLKANAESPDTPLFLYRIAKGHFFLWQFDDAISTYRELLRKFPKSPWAEKGAYEIGLTLFTRGEQHPGGEGPGMDTYEEAMDAYREFLHRFPKSELVPLAQFGIASCLEELDQLDAAYHQYEALRATYPSPQVIDIKLTRIRERKTQRRR